MTDKIRRIDFYPDDWLVGTATMSLEVRGLYITLVALIYSHGGPIPYDLKDLSHRCKMRPVRIKSLMEVLQKSGRIQVEVDLISNQRATKELHRAHLRVTKARLNGQKGGRPVNENNDIVKPDGSGLGKLPEKLTRALHQPSDNNHQEEEKELPDGNSKNSSKGTRISEDWKPTEVDMQKCRALGLDPETIRVEFIDYWLGVPGSKGLKSNWDSTYRNRCREKADWAKKQPKLGLVQSTANSIDRAYRGLR